MGIIFGILSRLPFHDCLMKHMKEVSIDTNRNHISRSIKNKMEITFGILSRLPFHDCLMKHMKEVSLNTNGVTLAVLSDISLLKMAGTVKHKYQPIKN